MQSEVVTAFLLTVVAVSRQYKAGAGPIGGVFSSPEFAHAVDLTQSKPYGQKT